MISDISPVNNYSGNGSATTFDFDFYIEDSSQLKVYKINSSGATIQLSEDIDYSVNSFTDDFSNGGYITFPLSLSTHDILSTDEKISLQLDIPFEQESEFGNSSLLNLNSLEFSLDYLTRLCQILKRQVARCAKIKEAIDVDPDSLSENINLLAEIKNDISTVSNAIDDVIVTSSNTENISSVAGNISNINAVKNNETNINAVNSNKTNIDTVADSISDVNTVAESIQDVNTVAGSIADINDVADDLTNINSVAGDLTNIDSVAGSISDVNTVAENIQDVNSVADNISNISAVKNNETNINAVNSNKTNIDTVADSISDVNTVAESIQDVNTVAGSIADINDVADDLTNINLVAGDLSNIDSASNYADNANVWAEGTDADVQDLGGVHSAKGWAEVAASGQIQADWNQSDNTKKDFIKNKPAIPSISNLANKDLSNLTATGEAHFAKVFIAEYGVTTYQEVLDAYNAGKTIVCLNSTTSVDYYYKIYQKSSSSFMFASCINNDIYTILLSETGGWGSINSRTLLQSKYVTHQSIWQTTSSAQGTLMLNDYTPLYKVVRYDTASSITIVFNTSNVNFITNTAYTFELLVTLSTAYTLAFPNSVTWQGGETPDMSETGTYFFVFRTMDAGTTWLGNLEGKW